MNETSVTVNIASCFSLHKDQKGPLWNESKALAPNTREHIGQVINSKKLFIFNHFVGVKALTETLDEVTRLLVNDKDYIKRRLEYKCYPGTNNKKPNYIALDFITKGLYSDLIKPFNL